MNLNNRGITQSPVNMKSTLSTAHSTAEVLNTSTELSKFFSPILLAMIEVWPVAIMLPMLIIPHRIKDETDMAAML